MAKQIHWYPGHMAKAERDIADKIKLVDLVIELVDARAPLSSRNSTFDRLIAAKPRVVLMSKADLADDAVTARWLDYYQEQGYAAMAVNLKTFRESQKLIGLCSDMMKEKRERDAARGLKPRAIRAMIIGEPNVGKSTLINQLAHRKAAQTGNKPGVTKAQQIIKIAKDFELFDTPGVLPPKYDDLQAARNVALIGSIKKDILPLDELFIYAVDYLNTHYPEALQERYGLSFDSEDDWVLPAYDQVARARHLPKAGGETDYDRVHDVFFKDISDGAFGRVSWEDVPCTND